MDSMILGVRVTHIDEKELERLCVQWFEEVSCRLHRVVTVNPEFIMEAQKNEAFRTILNTADCALADGVGLFFASWVLCGWNHSLHRITGVDFSWMLLRLASTMHKNVYLLGAGTGVAQRAAQRIRKEIPSVSIVDAEEGIPFICTQVSEKFHEELCKKITDTKTDILLVAFGAPKQDEWIARHAHLLPTVKIAVGVGGTFDYIAGTVPYAPQWVRSIGFEWTYRLMTQPHRWRRIIIAVILFPLAVLKEKFIHLNKR